MICVQIKRPCTFCFFYKTCFVFLFWHAYTRVQTHFLCLSLIFTKFTRLVSSDVNEWLYSAHGDWENVMSSARGERKRRGIMRWGKKKIRRLESDHVKSLGGNSTHKHSSFFPLISNPLRSHWLPFVWLVCCDNICSEARFEKYRWKIYEDETTATSFSISDVIMWNHEP